MSARPLSPLDAERILRLAQSLYQLGWREAWRTLCPPADSALAEIDRAASASADTVREQLRELLARHTDSEAQA